MNNRRFVISFVAISLLISCRERDKKKLSDENSSQHESDIGYYGTWAHSCSKAGSYNSYSIIKVILKNESGLNRYRMSTEAYSDSECTKQDLFRHEVGTFLAENPNQDGDFPLTLKVDKVFAVPHTPDRVQSFKTSNTCKTSDIQIAKPVLCMDEDVPQGLEYKILVGVRPDKFIEWAGAKGMQRPESLKSSSTIRMNAADNENIGF